MSLPPLPRATPWPSADPFLFCVHHLDEYPAGTDTLGPPSAALAGRSIGQDFAGVRGWNMYHGEEVPGFPYHPHRGFETLTLVRRGLVDHSDSLGATARFGAGDSQWITAGAGLLHSEMFPLVNADGPNPTELFQIWINLAPDDKHAPPTFSLIWAEDVPVVRPAKASGDVTVALYAGELEGQLPPPPPPRSWAARAEASVAVWLIDMAPGAKWSLPPVADGVVRTLYVFSGGIEGTESRVERLDAPSPHALVAGPEGAEVLLLQGRPIGAPVVSHGPFVMNDVAGIQTAIRDYQAGKFGRWPWGRPDPVHAIDAGRFAKLPDGTESRPGRG